MAHLASPKHDKLAQASDLISKATVQESWVRLFGTTIWNQLLALQQLRLASAQRSGRVVLRSSAEGSKYPPLHIIMSGDSTMRLQRNVLCLVLQPPFPSFMDVKEHLGAHPAPSKCGNDALNIRVTFHNHNCCDKVFRNNPAPGEATVFYFNCGLHLLHLGRARPAECPGPWMDYEDTVRNFIGQHEGLGGDQLNVFMTSHWICTNSFMGPYRKELQAWARDTTGELVEECAAKMQREYLKQAKKQQQQQQQEQQQGGGGRRRNALDNASSGTTPPASSADDEAGEDAQDGDNDSSSSHEGDNKAPPSSLQDYDSLSGTAAKGSIDDQHTVEDEEGQDADNRDGGQRQQQDGTRTRSLADFLRYCRDGLFTPDATSKLNARAMKVLAQHARSSPLEKHVHVVNGYSITQEQCWATSLSDGRHFPPLTPLEVLRLLDLMHHHFARTLNLSAQQQTTPSTAGGSGGGRRSDGTAVSARNLGRRNDDDEGDQAGDRRR